MEKYYDAAIGEKNSDYYLEKFNKYDNDGIKASWNWPAFFISFLWLLYRKMWLYAILYWSSPFFLGIALAIVTIPISSESTTATLFSLGQFVYLGIIFILLPMYANGLYYLHTKKKINTTLIENQDEQKALLRIASKGGTSGVPLVIILILVIIPVIGIFLAVALPVYQDYTARAQVSEGVTLLRSSEEPLANYYKKNGKWPAKLEKVSTKISGKYVERLQILEGADTSDHIIILAKFKSESVVFSIQGKTISISSDDGGKSWKCGLLALSGTTIEVKKYLPDACK
jgi:Tfp pilus assembly protein PilE